MQNWNFLKAFLKMKINAFNNLFSITNMPSKDNKWYKVFRIFGIKFSFRNKKKENKLKYENYYKFKNCPVEQRPKMLKEWYFNCTGEVLNLENPQTFSEKIQWLKLYDSTPLKTRLADKYLVCDWVKEKIGEEYLIPLPPILEQKRIEVNLFLYFFFFYSIINHRNIYIF